jgi:hypothetical protein
MKKPRRTRAARAHAPTAPKRKADRSHPRRKLVAPVVPADAEIDSLRQELQRATSRIGPPRWNASPEDVQRSVMQLVLTLVEFIRRLLERQAIRRLEAHTLTKKETENVGLALMRLEETIQEIAAQFGLEPEDLKLDLGPVGKLM